MPGISTLKQVGRELRHDLTAAQERDPAARSLGRFEILLTYGGVQALLTHRVAHALHEAGVPLVPYAHRQREEDGHRSRDPSCRSDRPALFIDHGIGRRDRRDGRDRRDVTLYQGVTLGGTGFRRGKRHPTVGDDVMIGSGAKLLGPINVGAARRSAPTRWSSTTCRPNSTVVGNPGHPVRVDGKQPEGPDADWVHLPDPVADAISGLANRLNALEELVAEETGRTPEADAVTAARAAVARAADPGRRLSRSVPQTAARTVARARLVARRLAAVPQPGVEHARRHARAALRSARRRAARRRGSRAPARPAAAARRRRCGRPARGS